MDVTSYPNIVETLENPPIEPLPEDLQAQIGALKALVSIHKLLQEGNFPLSRGQDITHCLDFTMTLHKQIMEEAQAHPKAHLYPGFKLKEEVKSGSN